MFVDRALIYVRGGDGGDGVVSFRKEKYVPKGGPDGGDGGNGGHVIVKATAGLTNLAHLSNRRHWKADRGAHGRGKTMHGRSAEHLVIPVPPGTIVRDVDRDIVLRDLRREGEWVLVARGGRGGRGNTYFKSATNRAPRMREKGREGEERRISLELKVIADVGLVGLPNAGKSTLLSRISRARPEIADYPFTTKYPNLGVASADGERDFVVADIPGLIEGAHEGHGLGHEFLRHVERTRLLVHLVEGAPSDGSDPLENYLMIRRELREYSERLASRPEIVALTKLDVCGAEGLERFREGFARLAERGDAAAGVAILGGDDEDEDDDEPRDRTPLGISAVTGRGIPQLLGRIVRELERIPADEDEEPPMDEGELSRFVGPSRPTAEVEGAEAEAEAELEEGETADSNSGPDSDSDSDSEVEGRSESGRS